MRWMRGEIHPLLPTRDQELDKDSDPELSALSHPVSMQNFFFF